MTDNIIYCRRMRGKLTGCPAARGRDGERKLGSAGAWRRSSSLGRGTVSPLCWYNRALGAHVGGRQKIRPSSPLNVPESPVTKLRLQRFVASLDSRVGYRRRGITRYPDPAQLRAWGAPL